MEINKKAAYLRGLMDGLQIDPNTKEGKLFAALVDAFDSMSEELSALKEQVNDIDAFTSDLDEDVSELYEDFYGLDSDEYDEEEDMLGGFSIDCPHCGQEIPFNPQMVETGEFLLCPKCKKQVTVFTGLDPEE